MPDLNTISLDAFPDAAVLVSQMKITASNAMARHYLPQLEAGALLPNFMVPLQDSADAAGSFSAGFSTYTFTRTLLSNGLLILFRPAPQTALTDTQLDGALRQMRQFMAEFLVELQQDSGQEQQVTFQKSFYRLFRLVENLDLMRAAGSAYGLPFSPTTVDLAGLCQQVIAQANTLLSDCGVSLLFVCDCTSLLVPGDAQLLQRLLLELISNSARAVGQGTISIQLRSQGGRALLSVSDSGGTPTQRQIFTMLQQASDHQIPDPGVGAGLGLPIVRHIVQLHNGTILVHGSSAAITLVSLPTGPLDTHVSVQTPRIQRDGGLSPLLVALSDVLPAQLLGLEGLD